ncbi:hypothetical protein [Membranihabitans marinus]|uniref:hypothetical protein n=1 Tax=Membranihabitans marinus TaxID=1227546 RepID=UPI001F25BE99|nr:hypothetical protein [Membranihabitans marinus]
MQKENKFVQDSVSPSTPNQVSSSDSITDKDNGAAMLEDLENVINSLFQMYHPSDIVQGNNEVLDIYLNSPETRDQPLNDHLISRIGVLNYQSEFIVKLAKVWRKYIDGCERLNAPHL